MTHISQGRCPSCHRTNSVKVLTQPVAWPHPFCIHHWAPNGRASVPLVGLQCQYVLSLTRCEKCTSPEYVSWATEQHLAVQHRHMLQDALLSSSLQLLHTNNNKFTKLPKLDWVLMHSLAFICSYSSRIDSLVCISLLRNRTNSITVIGVVTIYIYIYMYIHMFLLVSIKTAFWQLIIKRICYVMLCYRTQLLLASWKPRK